jgi:hypothetical protein
MSLILPMMGNYPQGPLVHDWSFVGLVSSKVTSITIPAAAQEGDLCVLFDTTVSQNPFAPAGFTMIASFNETVDTAFSYRKLGAGEGGTAITGMAGVPDYRTKVMIVIRPDVDVTITTGVFQGTLHNNDDPPEITVNTSAMTNSGVAIGIIRNFNAPMTVIGEENWADEIGYEANSGIVSKMYYKPQTIGNLTNPSLDMPDQGSFNALGGIYFEGTPV